MDVFRLIPGRLIFTIHDGFHSGIGREVIGIYMMLRTGIIISSARIRMKFDCVKGEFGTFVPNGVYKVGKVLSDFGSTGLGFGVCEYLGEACLEGGGQFLHDEFGCFVDVV